MTKNALAGSVLVSMLALVSSCGDSDGPESSGAAGTSGGAAGSGGEAGSAHASAGKGGRGGTSGGTNSAGAESGGSGGQGGGEAGAAGEPAGGDAGASGDAGAGGGVTCPSVNQFPVAYAEYICAKNVECCGSDAATCSDTVEEALRAIYTDLGAAVVNGAAELDCDAYLECVAAIEAASCDIWPKELSAAFGIPVDAAACRNIIVGNIESGAGSGGNQCTDDYQCVNGYCRDPDGEEGAEPLQCIGFKRTGEACLTAGEASEQADPTQLCNPVTHFCNELSHMCEVRREDGAVCTEGNQCASRECVEGECVRPSVCEHVPEEPVVCSVSAPGARVGSGFAPSAVWLIALGLVLRRRRARLSIPGS